MILRYIKISELIALTSGIEYASWKNIPISPARAYSQSLNPYADPEDIALVIALDDDNREVLAYAGAYPSKMQNAEKTSFAWNSCWWVAEGEGGDAGMKVFISFLKIWEKRAAFSDMTEKTFKIIENLGFCQTMKRDGIVLNIRPGFNSRLRALSYSGRKISIFTKPLLFIGIPWLADQVTELFLNGTHRFKPGRADLVKALKLQSPEDNDFGFMKKHANLNFHIPEAAELDLPKWLVKPGKQSRFLTKKYYFSSFSIDFSTFWLRWEGEGKTKALAMLSLKDGVLKTLYIYFEEEFKDKFPEVFMDYCLSNTAVRTIITAQPILTQYLSGQKHFMSSLKNFTRYSAISKDLLHHFPGEPILQDGDGDYRFT
jgi:hypothetical protein